MASSYYLTQSRSAKPPRSRVQLPQFKQQSASFLLETPNNRTLDEINTEKFHHIERTFDLTTREPPRNSHLSLGRTSKTPGSRPKRDPSDNLPPISQHLNDSNNDLLKAMLDYQPKSEFIINALKQKPQHWKLQTYPNAVYYGEMLNSRRHGRGIILLQNGNVYEGEWENDLKHGNGLEIAATGSVYEGYYRNGKPDGYGVFLWSNGEVYEGDWRNGIKHGHGIWKGTKGESYVGEWKYDKQEGYGVLTLETGEKYEGEFLNFTKHGQGKESFANGDYFVGKYVNGKPQDYGEYHWANGSFYKGMFVNGLRHGLGVWKKGPEEADTYEGEWANDKKCGNGIYTWKCGDYYTGNFFDNQRDGNGEMHWTDGRIYKGQWHAGKQHGEGILTAPNQPTLKGIFQHGKFIGEEGVLAKRPVHNDPQECGSEQTAEPKKMLISKETFSVLDQSESMPVNCLKPNILEKTSENKPRGMRSISTTKSSKGRQITPSDSKSKARIPSPIDIPGSRWLSKQELLKWNSMKHKLFINLSELEDLSDEMVCQKIKFLVNDPAWFPAGRKKILSQKEI